MIPGYDKVASAPDIAPGHMLRVSIRGRWILVANVGGQFFAISDTCSHEDASLFKGALQGHCVRCPLHGSRFDLRTGEPLEEPADRPVEVFRVKVMDSEVYVSHDAMHRR